MKRISYFFFVAVAFFACSKDSVEPFPGGIVGSVLDKTTGEPVATVNVSLSHRASVVTGSDGTFSFEKLDAGEYTVSVSKDGYLPKEAKFSVESGKPTLADLLIERIPAKITTDCVELNFGDNASLNMLSFKIVNNSYKDLKWEVEQKCSWIIKIEPFSGLLKHPNTENIEVSIDRDLLAAGNNETVLVVKSSNGKGGTQVKVRAIGEERRLPVLNMLDATEVVSMAARLNGFVVNAGAPEYTELGFVYDTLPEPSLERTMRKLTVALSADSKFNYVLKDLILGKTYYVRAYAKNAIGTAYSSNEISFTTQATLPEVSVQEATDVDVLNGKAILHGTVINTGDPNYIEKGFVYGLDMNPTIEDIKLVVNGMAERSFNTNVSALPLEQLFYVRAYAVSVAGTVYSSGNVKVSTKKMLAEVTTQEATDTYTAAGMAILHGKVINAGVPAYVERGFVYGTTQTPTINDRKVVAEGSGSVSSFSCKVTDLPEGVVYIRAYATNSAGTVYGNVITVKPTWIELQVNGNKIAVQREDIGMGSRTDMIEKCNDSKLGAYTDWRLPTKEELTAIYENREAIGGFCTQANSDKSYYWSFSTWSSINPVTRMPTNRKIGSSVVYNYYYYLYFNNGALKSTESCADVFSARCVRTIE